MFFNNKLYINITKLTDCIACYNIVTIQMSKLYNHISTFIIQGQNILNKTT